MIAINGSPAVYLRRTSNSVLQFVYVYAVVMVLQLLSCYSRCSALLLLVVRHCRGAAAKAERKLKRVAKDAAKPAPECDVDDEIGRRVDDEKQFADDIETHKMAGILETVLKVTLSKRHLNTNTTAIQQVS